MNPYTLADAEQELRAAIDQNDTQAIAALEPIIDKLKHRPAATLEQAALWYAEQGLHVFPLRPGSKIPAPKCDRCRTTDCTGPDLCGHTTCHGFKDASTNADQIRAWWAKWPSANIGIATGHLVDVIDIDGPPGVETWARLKDDLPPILGKVSTPRPGGNHLYVQAVAGRGNKAGLFPGIDYRGTGGYVVAPPSTITTGSNPGAYSWYQPLTSPARQVAA